MRSKTHRVERRRHGARLSKRWRRTFDGVLLTGVATPVALGLAAGGSGPGGAQDQTAPSTKEVSTQAVRFDSDVRHALAPMLVHVREMPRGLEALAAGPGRPNEDLAGQAVAWAQGAVTAADQVTRLEPLPHPDGAEVLHLFTDATLLYTEAARSAARAAGMGDGQQEAARSAHRLLLLGDRVFDAGRRLFLHRFGDPGSERRVYPLEVPDFVKEGLDPDQPGPAAEGRSGFQSEHPATLTGDEWSARKGRDILAARRLLDDVPNLDASGFVPEARRLASLAQNLADLVPEDRSAREGVVALRLALMVEAEALRTLAASDSDGPVAAERLRKIEAHLWASGARLLDRAGAGEWKS